MTHNSTQSNLQQRITELELETERLRQVEAALTESEHLSKQYLNLPGVICLALDKEGNITLINEKGLEILGYRREELLGKNWFKTCLPHKLQREVLGIYHQLMRDEIESVDYHENQILRKDGRECVIAWNNTILQNLSGEIVGTLSSGEDITERKQVEEKLKESKERYKILVENIDIGITMIDSDHNIIMTNAMVGKWFDKSPSEFVGKKCYREFEKKDHVCSYCPGVRAMATGLACEVESEGVKDNGSCFIVRDRAFPLFDSNGTVIGFHEIVEDITERKQVEDELNKHRDYLEELVANRTKELQQKTLYLEESNIALKVLLQHREEDKKDIGEKVLYNIEKLVFPYLAKLKIKMAEFDECAYVEAIESNLKEIIAPFGLNLSGNFLKLSPAEIQIADLIKMGKTTKEIAKLLKLSPTTIATHRQNIRKKLALTNKKTNLRSTLTANQK